MKKLFLCFMLFTLSGCDIFRYEVGGEGQPCFDNLTCRAGFACDKDKKICVKKCASEADCPDDGVFCNGEEYCAQSGLCAHNGDPCSGKVCVEEARECVSCTKDSDCDDGIFCTVDACENDSGNCSRTPSDDLCPDDGFFCNGTEYCDAENGCLHTGDPCPRGDCDEGRDTCGKCGNGQLDADQNEQCDPGSPKSDHCCDPGTCRWVTDGGADPKNFCSGASTCQENVCDGSGGCKIADLPDGSRCGVCKTCKNVLCVPVGVGEDPHDDCQAVTCHTGTCDGAGACGKLPAGSEGDEGGAAPCPACQDCDGAGSCADVSAGTKDSGCEAPCLQCDGSGNCAYTPETLRDDCNDDLSDGCETSLETLTDCGSCGTPCPPANNATSSCTGGVCHVESCDLGFANIDGNDQNGCEACDPAYFFYPDCNQCSADAFGEYPYCFLPAAGYCDTSQCFPVTPTNQTQCYNDSDTMPCTVFPCNADGSPDFCGQDAQYPDNPRVFTCYNASGTVQDPCDSTADQDEVVTDSLTGLMWQRTWVSDRTWQQAVDYCNDLVYAGHDDWRLPNPLELQSIVHYDRRNPAIDTTVFPGTPSGGFWSSSSCANPAHAWYVYFVDGYVDYEDKGYIYGARCVRPGPSSTQGGGQRFTVEEPVAGEQVVHDAVTGLVWQKSYATSKTWQQALTYCEGLNYAGFSDWRLPNVKELTSLVNYARFDPASDFPDMPYFTFWSS